MLRISSFTHYTQETYYTREETDTIVIVNTTQEPILHYSRNIHTIELYTYAIHYSIHYRPRC